ncbi:diguanylate cyclase, partial [Acinetobacter baumannii]
QLPSADAITQVDVRQQRPTSLPAVERLSRPGRADEPLALLYLDLDDFKTVNDTHGHAAGDRLLESVAERMRGLLREGD